MANTTQVRQDVLAPDYLTTQRANPQQVTFTPQQLAYLERCFPEVLGAEAMTEAQVRHRLGQRSVVAHIRDKVAR